MESNKKDFINNPLGIIGLFLIIVEGIAALVLTQSNLPDKLNEILVWFIVFFPLAVLLSFLFLVSCHHDKLYSPKDFKEEKNFLAFSRKVTGEVIVEEKDCSSKTSKKSSHFITTSNAISKIPPMLKEDEEIRKNSFFAAINLELNNHKFIQEMLSDKKIKTKNYSIEKFEGLIDNNYDDDTFSAMWIGANSDIELTKEVLQIMLGIEEIETVYLNKFIENQIFIGSVADVPEDSSFYKIGRITNQQELNHLLSKIDMGL